MANFEVQLKRRNDLLFCGILFFALGIAFLYEGWTQNQWYGENHLVLSGIAFLCAFIDFVGYRVSVYKEMKEILLVTQMTRPQGRSIENM